ncbi:Hypothetical Protein FCC1311_052702 [Hondaea fermentalgiana]|uniref:Uncharacterized protein n=1 Tax=Hondaea fermentalgiana TaxID=2315210 RepID=A0A2R5GH20_9STRA|nr:Hypothetical Protein FCC1311_052702 [Hondaea fermentalgiana]|eukprot:GBG29048.1 Hypothetical Protein FCC1311_052702 [Hondaea fermentalgiana]
MTSKAKQLFQNWELDITEAKQKFENRVRSQLNELERRVLKSSGLEVIDDNVDDLVDQSTPRQQRGNSTGSSNDPNEGSEYGGDTDSDADSTAPGVKRTIVIDKTRDTPPEHPRIVIGRIRIRVKSMLVEKFGDTKAYFEIQVEDEKFVSPVAFKQAGKAFVWEIGGEFDITDITGGFTVTVWSKNLLKTSDRLLGRVWIPFASYDAKIDEEGRVNSTETGNYALFPVRTKSVRAVPGHRRAMETAMDKNEFLENLLLTVEHAVTLDEAHRYGGSLLPLYFVNAGYMHLAPQRKAGPLKSLASSPQAILDSVSDLKRNAARIKSAVKAISESVPVQAFAYAMSWENPAVSVAGAIFSLLFSRYVTAPLLPVVCFLGFAISCLAARQPSKEKRSSWVLWNEEIDLDPELTLTPLQRYARIVQKIEEIAQLLNKVACVFEKIINLSNFADPNATKAVMLTLCAGSVLLGTAIFVSRSLSFSFPGLCLFFSIMYPLFVRSDRSKERVTWFETAMTGAYNRIPSNDDVGARWVTERQRMFPIEKALEAEEEAKKALEEESESAEVETKSASSSSQSLDEPAATDGASPEKASSGSSLRHRFSSNRTIME